MIIFSSSSKNQYRNFNNESEVVLKQSWIYLPVQIVLSRRWRLHSVLDYILIICFFAILIGQKSNNCEEQILFVHSFHTIGDQRRIRSNGVSRKNNENRVMDCLGNFKTPSLCFVQNATRREIELHVILFYFRNLRTTKTTSTTKCNNPQLTTVRNGTS